MTGDRTKMRVEEPRPLGEAAIHLQQWSGEPGVETPGSHSISKDHSDTPGATPPRVRRHYGRWRAACLIAVYVLMIGHVIHWRLAGTSLAPLELNELMYTLEQGIITAGFLFMALAVLSIFIFGRFFCSWGCHILALQDLCAWLLKKIGIRPKPVRSRLLLLVPLGAVFYMFIWPQIARIISGDPLPVLHVRASDEAWGSFLTDDFWRNLPGPWIAGLTFLICGFAIVYVLGSRSFCKYGCPYGALFAVADRFAPGQLVDNGDCDGCGICTANCTTHIRVHEELKTFGKIVNPDCLKDLDCVSVCPRNAIRFRFTTPALFKSMRRKGRRIPRPDFTLAEECLMAAVFVAALFVFRGLYGAVPFLMSIGLGLILSYIALLGLRMSRRSDVRLNNFQLKRDGRSTTAGILFSMFEWIVLLFVVHSAFIRYNEFRGERAFNAVRIAMAAGDLEAAAPEAGTAIAHLETCQAWGLVRPIGLQRRLASLHELGVNPGAAIPFLQAILDDEPDDHEARLRLAHLLMRLQRIDEAEVALAAVTAAALDAGDAEAAVHFRERVGSMHILFAQGLETLGRTDESIIHRQTAATLDPRFAGDSSMGELRGSVPD